MFYNNNIYFNIYTIFIVNFFILELFSCNKIFYQGT